MRDLNQQLAVIISRHIDIRARAAALAPLLTQPGRGVLFLMGVVL
jgi:hypothetical protein